MKSVCAKHEEAFETELGCPWCETERVEAAAELVEEGSLYGDFCDALMRWTPFDARGQK